MELSLVLALPRDAVSVPVARRVLRSALSALGVEGEVVGDIELAVTEACTNVLDHAQDDDDYEICVGLRGSTCVIEVVDRSGTGFGGEARGHVAAADDAEEGRGIKIMRDLLDRLSFQSDPERGSVVRMEKELVLAPTSPLAVLDGSAS